MLDTADISGDSVSCVAIDVIEMITRAHIVSMSDESNESSSGNQETLKMMMIQTNFLPLITLTSLTIRDSLSTI